MEFNKRTFLWLVFSFSLLLLWNEWMVSKGGQSLFSTTPAPVATAPATGAAGTTALPSAPGAATPAVPGAQPAAQPVQAETITVTTDVVKANISTLGGVISRLELLQFRDGIDPTRNQVLFDHAGAKTYLGQTGSWPSRAFARSTAATRCKWCWKRSRAASS
jgi:YidC/Oxa1 family membrane protein insertase